MTTNERTDGTVGGGVAETATRGPFEAVWCPGRRVLVHATGISGRVACIVDGRILVDTGAPSTLEPFNAGELVPLTVDGFEIRGVTLAGSLMLGRRLADEEPARPGDVVSSVRVDRGAPGGHDRVRVWNRGGLSGELVVTAGDGELVADRLRTPWLTLDSAREDACRALEAAERDFLAALTKLGAMVHADATAADVARVVADVIVDLGDAAIVASRAAREARKAARR